MHKTHHGQARVQQRAVPGLMISLLLQHGASVWRHGAEVRYVDKQARRKIKSELGGDRSARIIEKWFNSYIVVGSDGVIITVGRRTRRLKVN
jgi:hypothetical protein